MSASPTTPGIHHITAISGSARENLRFYTGLLGLRLVKKTVNFDDPGTYHLYYGDESGTPGTILTFFPWEKMPAGRPGTGQVAAVGFSVAAQSIDFWRQRLTDSDIAVNESRRFGKAVLEFVDPHGLPLEMVAGDAPPPAEPGWAESVPSRHAVRGFHSATARLRSAANTSKLLTQVLGMEPVGSEGGRTRYRSRNDRGPGLYFDIVEDPRGPAGTAGVGTVHHIAFRAADEAQQLHWRQAVAAFGLDVTPVIDRKYFRSIYFRDTGGVLFEMATDPPGFTVDEDLSTLGSGLMLPQRYEPMRAEIEESLPPLGEEDAVSKKSTATMAG